LRGALAEPIVDAMPTTFITGANKGLGYETARRLIELGHDVVVGARDPARGAAAAEQLGARFVPIDVTSDESVRAAADSLGALDVLVNNAGINGRRKPVAETTADDLLYVYDTNVFGIVRVMGAFAPLLAHSANPVVVNVSSGMGSMGVTTDPDRLESGIVGLAYQSSKAAVNMLTTQYAKAYPGMRINAVDPGYTATDFNQHRGVQPVEQGAEIIVRMADIDATGPTGAYLDAAGTVPW
jgi:NAD(P)-dependent dehydrogenase (short-subunit alcohol dehydrogenase family)